MIKDSYQRKALVFSDEVQRAIDTCPSAVARINAPVPWRVTLNCKPKGHALITVYGSVEGSSVDLWPIAEHQSDRVRSLWLPDGRLGYQKDVCCNIHCTAAVQPGSYLCPTHEADHVNDFYAPVTGLVCVKCAKDGRPRVIQVKFSTLRIYYLVAAEQGVHKIEVRG